MILPPVRNLGTEISNCVGGIPEKFCTFSPLAAKDKKGIFFFVVLTCKY